jgi:glycosyltransferase involved in cell wall biosynthesis
MSVLLVDWLGRGGIAQTSEAWAIELEAAGADAIVVTRAARELGSGAVVVDAARARRGRLTAHREVARHAESRIRDVRPDVVVVQNYVAPILERPVFDAAHDVGARVVIVVHDHRLHTARAGTRAGLRRELRRADVVVTHTHHVADGVSAYSGRDDVLVMPHPVQVGMLRHEAEPVELPEEGRLRAVTFGVLKRSYKGAPVVGLLAAQGVDGWSFLAVGTGAPEGTPGITALPGYAPPGRLTAVVGGTDATLAPYTHATQSGVVVLAHVLGSVPVASAVGGIPEQIDDGVDGLLLAPNSPVAAWRDALEHLAEDDARKAMAVAGVARAWRDHEDFARMVREVVA